MDKIKRNGLLDTLRVLIEVKRTLGFSQDIYDENEKRIKEALNDLKMVD